MSKTPRRLIWIPSGVIALCGLASLLFIVVGESRRRVLNQAMHVAVVSEIADFHRRFLATKGISRKEYVAALSAYQLTNRSSLLQDYCEIFEERSQNTDDAASEPDNLTGDAHRADVLVLP